MDYTSFEVQDWYALESQLLDKFQKREEQAEQQRLQRRELRPGRLQRRS